MFRIKFFGFLAAFLFIGLTVLSAESISDSRFLQITSGEYRFRLQVIGLTTKIEIHNATANISISNNRASVEIFAPGYRHGVRDFDLIAGVFYYEGLAYLNEPTTFTFLRDHNLKQLNGGLSYLEWEPCNNCWYDEICIAGEFPKAGFEKLSINDFHAHINWTHDYAYPPRVFLFDREDKWGFEIMVDRSALKPNKTNHMDIIITRNGEHNQPETKYLQHLASSYRAGLKTLSKVADEDHFMRLHARLEATATELTRNFASLSPESQIEILDLLPYDGPLTRSLKSISIFSHLHE